MNGCVKMVNIIYTYIHVYISTSTKLVPRIDQVYQHQLTQNNHSTWIHSPVIQYFLTITFPLITFTKNYRYTDSKCFHDQWMKKNIFSSCRSLDRPLCTIIIYYIFKISTLHLRLHDSIENTVTYIISLWHIIYGWKVWPYFSRYASTPPLTPYRSWGVESPTLTMWGNTVDMRHLLKFKLWLDIWDIRM